MTDLERRYIAGQGWRTVAVTEGGGGGSLPDWWLVDSTPGRPGVEFDGQVGVVVQAADMLALYVYGATGQTEDLVHITDNLDDGNDLVIIGPSGAVTISPTEPTVDSLARVVAPAGFADETEGDGNLLGLFSTDLDAYVAQWDIYGNATFTTGPSFSSSTVWKNGDDSAEIRFTVSDSGVGATFGGGVAIVPMDPATQPLTILDSDENLRYRATFDTGFQTFSAAGLNVVNIGVSHDGEVLFSVSDHNSAPVLTIRENAGVPEMGFFGNGPQPQPTGVAADVNAIRNALVTLGLIAL